MAWLAVIVSSASAWAATEPSPVAVEWREVRQLIAEKQWAEATLALKSMQRRSPNDLGIQTELAKTLTFAGRREEALSLYQQIAALERGERRKRLLRQARVVSRIFLTNATFQTYQEGMNFLAARKFRQARDRFQKALDQEPSNVEILTRLGQCLVMDGDYDSAAERLRLARRLSPQESEISLWLGRALHQRGEINEALQELKGANAELEHSELAPVWLAEALLTAGQRQQAVQVLEEDVKGQPFHLLALYTLAKIKVSSPSADATHLWSARKDLQLAMSRLERYQSAQMPRFESELGLELRSADDIKARIDELLSQIDGEMQNKR